MSRDLASDTRFAPDAIASLRDLDRLAACMIGRDTAWSVGANGSKLAEATTPPGEGGRSAATVRILTPEAVQRATALCSGFRRVQLRSAPRSRAHCGRPGLLPRRRYATKQESPGGPSFAVVPNSMSWQDCVGSSPANEERPRISRGHSRDRSRERLRFCPDAAEKKCGCRRAAAVITRSRT